MTDKKGDKNPKKFPVNSYWLYGIVIFMLLAVQAVTLISGKAAQLSVEKFKEIAKKGDIEKVEVVNKNYVKVYLQPDKVEKYSNEFEELKNNKFKFDQPHFAFEIGGTNFYEVVKDVNTDNVYIDPVYKTETNYLSQILSWIIPFALIIGLWVFFMRRVGSGGAGPGGQIFNIGKSKATLFDSTDAKVNVTFKDVAGLEEAKEEVMEVVDFLKNPKKYTSLGGKIPKGVLLVGPPGTGKTLLAKAVAGEAGVPFFSISGSDFVEMFVGVGASRVRDLFKQAREKAPCIIFIDEIDAIGRARGKGAMQGGNDERENTLNQLLVEMDGFSTDKGVILMAATNRPDILDNALMRPGRFDRQIGIDRPDLVGREAIFKVHLKNIKVSEEMDAATLAEMTPGFAGAEIANVCNEAALVAARRNKKAVEMSDFNYALDRVIGGLEKKNKIIAPFVVGS